MRASERIAWAVAQLDPQPGERILELGCGHGVALTLIAERLGGRGLVVGLDRSPKMVAAATARNAAAVEAGLVVVVGGELARAELDGRFDRVLAIHFPPLQRGEPAAELERLRAHLAPDGELLVAFAPHRPQEVDAIGAHVRRTLARHGWRPDAPIADGGCGAVRARP